MLGFNSFRRAQTLLAGIELIHMICKGRRCHPTEQFYLLVARKNGSATFTDSTSTH